MQNLDTIHYALINMAAKLINMLNEEIYRELCKLYTKEEMQIFTTIICDMYRIRIDDMEPEEAMLNTYEHHFWKLKNININIHTNEDGTDRQPL